MFTWQDTKNIRERNARARMREKIIYDRYFIKGEHLEQLAKELGYTSISSIEKAVLRIRKERNLPSKRVMTGEAMEDPLIMFNNSNNEILLFRTAKQIRDSGFKPSCVKNALIKESYTKVRFGISRKNSIKWFVVLAKDYKSRPDDDVLIKREIAKIKMKYVF